VAEPRRITIEICTASAASATVGFTATGEAARAAELILTEALREKRGLSNEETHSLKGAIERLQHAAESELRSMYQRGR
jgi:hypothetical protein